MKTALTNPQKNTIPPMDIIDVTCAVIIRKGRILAVQRGVQMSRPGKWEFPGGKIEKGETKEQCIVREIREELDTDIAVKEWLEPVVHHYPDISIRLLPCIAEIISGEIKLKEHSSFKWIPKDKLSMPDWADADIDVVQQAVSSSSL
jgi:8-oxo-dGTP diphosphatase